MGRHKYRLTLKRRKGLGKNASASRELTPDKENRDNSDESKETEVDHSTPIKKHRGHSWGIPLSPVQESEDNIPKKTLSSLSQGNLSDSLDDHYCDKSVGEPEKSLAQDTSCIKNNRTCSDHEISGLTLCDKCGKYDAASNSMSCVHNYSSDALCEKCGRECLWSGTHTVRGSNVSQAKPCDVDNLSSLCEAAHAKLMEIGRGDFLEKLLEVIVSGRLDLEGLTFHIISDTVNALSVESLTQMRFSWQSKCFWKLLLTKCGGMALRLLSGWKSIGSLLTEDCKRGFLDTEKSDIVLAVPDEENLKKFDPYDGEWPSKLPPGFSEKIAAKVANSASVKESSVCLSLDGKKITPGLKDEKGDIDLLGMEEDGITLRKRQETYAEEQEFIAKTCQLVGEFETTSKKSELVRSLQWNMTLLSKKTIQLNEELERKNYALDRLKKLGGEDYKNSRYSFVIQLVIATQVELRECLETGRSLRTELVKILAVLHRKQSLILESAVCLSNLPNFYALHDMDSLLNSGNERKEELAAFLLREGPQYVKQRSKAWFSFRKEVKVTGSTIFAAVGADGLKAQREHFLQTVRGKEAPAFTPEVQQAIRHGEVHESDAIATFCTKFLPSFLPDCAVYEVGCYQVKAGNVPMLVSPDGIVKNMHTGKVEAVLEVKCPYTAKLHTGIPTRYYLQVQAEMMALDVEYCYFVSYKKDETRIFKVSKDLDTWSLAVACIEEVYGNAKDKVPVKLSENSKVLSLNIKKAVTHNCILLAQVPSVSVFESTERESHYDTFTTHVVAEPNLSVHPGIQELVDVKQTLSTMETVSANNKKMYQLLRRKATEVVTLVASDTDRIWSRNQVIGAPICYFLKGYSLSMTIMQSILENTLEKLHKIGMHVPCVSFDGQFMKLVREDRSGKPQTLLQLQKHHWQKVTKMQKTTIVAEFRNAEMIRKNKNTPPKTYVAYLKKGDRVNPIQELNILPEVSQEDAICLEDIHLPTTEEHLEVNMPDIEHVEVEDLVKEQQQDHRVESDEAKSIHITHQQYVDLLVDLSNEFDRWKDKTVDELKVVLTQCDRLAKLKIPELKVVARFLKHQMDMDIVLSGTKFNILCRLKKLLSLEGTIVAKSRRKTIQSLIVLSSQVLQSNGYPKAALNASYAQWTFQNVKEEWQHNSKIQHGMIIPEVDATRRIDWFYIPEYSQTRKQLEVKKIDTHHLLTRHRSALCKGNLGKSSRSHFIEVAGSGKTALKPGMMEQQLNMQSTDYARITFSQGVQKELEERGYQDSAELCKYVREWFDSCDEPGISAVERCRMKLQYRDYLLSLVDFSSFPPPGSHIRGYSTSLWESTVAAIDTDFMMYAITRRRTYNNRALGSQPCESLYSCLATMPGAKNGVPSCVDLEVNMAKICGECIVRHDPTRGFSARLSSAPVYPQQLLERDTGPLPLPQDPPAFIHQIRIQNHLFDSRQRRRLTRKQPKGLTAPHEPGKGAVGIRNYHKVNECKLNPLIRAGISITNQQEATS